jgi:16S rRNA (guanine966-N2)-methyltransferase
MNASDWENGPEREDRPERQDDSACGAGARAVRGAQGKAAARTGGVKPGLRNTVRIVAGARRSRRLRVSPGSTVRPTGEMVREAIFDSLGPVGGLAVLDLFAGTGAMGLEALSRGAGRCLFVEADRRVAEVLRENISDLEYEAEGKVIVADYLAALQDLKRAEERFDLLFVDPPYRILTQVEVTLKPFIASLMEDNGVVVFESDKGSHPTLGAVPVFDRVYGDTRVTMVTVESPY